ncbi:adenylate cyclase, class 1 [Gammaproteobacteria bacterium]
MAFSVLTNTASASDKKTQYSGTPPVAPLDDQRDLTIIKKRFLRINQERLHRTQDSLRQRQKDFIDLLPLLFHVNHPMLPGYISKATPCGISDYQPTQESIKAARRFANISGFGRQLLPSYAVYSIFIMGSVGTVAHSEKSDLDIWLCHNPNLSAPELAELGKKGTAIEEWALTRELEVHFFLMDADKFKAGQCGDVDSESSGTAQHHLLLEEFYRTGLYVAGRYPAWWLIPPEYEHDYDNCLRSLIDKRFIASDDIIDFGGLPDIPAAEFFGAGLWQVYKGIDSPYKSVLKILLMEIYAKEYPNIDLLCLRYKKAVYIGITGLDQLDPYIMLINKLEEYLNRRNEPLRLDLVRRCFYLKINIALSTEGAARTVSWRRELMESLITAWEWDKNQLALIDAHDTWKIGQVLKERKILIEELTNSYRLLSNFGREHAQLLSISQNDLNILGRKLYAAFERKPEKIDIVYRGIVKDLTETHITIQKLSDQEGKEGWLLLNSAPNKIGAAQKKEPIKQSLSVMTLLAWGYFNKIIGQNTMIALQARNTILDMKEINAVIRCLREFSPNAKLPPLETEYLNKPPQIVGATLFVNIGIDPMGRYNRAGSDLISNRGDVLSYGNAGLNLAGTLDLLLLTSWQEVLNFSYTGVHGLVESLCQYLYWNVSSEGVPPPPLPKIYSFSSSYALSLVRRIEDLYMEAHEFFLGDRTTQTLRYLLVCGNLYYLLYIEGGALRYIYKESFAEIQRLLAEPNPQFACLHIDQCALVDTPLPLIYRINQANTIQLFYQVVGKNVNIYVLDENGSLYYQRAPFYDDDVLVNHFEEFFEVTLGERSIYSRTESSGLPRIGVMFYKIRNENGSFAVSSKTSLRQGQQKSYFKVRVTSNAEENSHTFYCDDREFSSYRYGNNLFQEVANHILAQRRRGMNYPIYITGIDLPPALLNNRAPNTIQMVDFLSYKKRIEDKLNEKINFEAE